MTCRTSAPHRSLGKPSNRRSGSRRVARRRAPPSAGPPRAAAPARPPTGRRRVAPDRGRCPAHWGRSRTTSAGRLSSRSPRKRGCRRRPSLVHSANPIWATSSGRIQCVPRGIGRASTNGDSGVSSSRNRAPRSRSVAARVPGPDLTGVSEPAVLVIPDEQRAEVGPAAGGIGVTADHELLLPHALDFNQSLERPATYGACARLAISPSQPDRHAWANRRCESSRHASLSCNAAPGGSPRSAARGARAAAGP